MTSESTSTSTSSSRSTVTFTDASVISDYNRGAVYTTFTPPASCLSTLTYSSNMYFGHRGNGYFDSACYPETRNVNASGGWNFYYYSPAQCPQGWQQATKLSTQLGIGSSGIPTQIPLDSETTAYVCCPSGYTYAGLGHQCQSLALARTTFVYKKPDWDGQKFIGTDGSGTNLRTTTYTTEDPYTLFGDGIPVWWQSSDLKLFATPPTSTSTTTSQTTTGTSTSDTSAPTNTGSPSSGGGGLSTGAKIGIGIGVPIVVIALAALAFGLWYRARKRYRVVNPELEGSSVGAGAPVMDHKYGGPPVQTSPVELHSSPSVATPQGTDSLYAASPYEPYRRTELPAS
ncbi:hypothetical protein B0O99DRAFT_611517 [Bisporella sp. PMI_857]|nr:hypothetical protein B0O99DRAFT_611517 [Bisporella sp. PMI_857]